MTHPSETPEYWERLASEERKFAEQDRRTRATVESIRIHESNATEYEARARSLRAGPSEEDVQKAIQQVKAELESPGFAEALSSIKSGAIRPSGAIYIPGRIVEFSWGYDQTNIDYYLITRRTDKFVTLQKIGSKDVSRPDSPWATGQSVPDPDNVLPDKPIRRKVQVWDGKEQGVAIESYGWASLWDGKPSNWTAYA